MVEKLISVVITAYNHAQYLRESIESVLAQTYRDFEIILIDDGSTDNTKMVAARYPQVTYLYQTNQGVSAARNAGVRQARGEYLCFLDADDWLLPQALEINFNYLQTNNALAFVSGAYLFAHVHYPLRRFVASQRFNLEERYLVNEPKKPILKDHYSHFLKGNYVGMHAAVLYRRWVFDEHLFEPDLHRCEDYELFLRIARKNVVFDHGEPIAVYRIHANNTTTNSQLMLDAALKVLDKQKDKLNSAEEEKSFNEGKKSWPKVYSNFVYQKLLGSGFQSKYKADDLHLLWIYNKKLYIKCLIKETLMEYKSMIKKVTPPFVLKGLRKLRHKTNYIPPVGKIKMGDLKRLDPFSRAFGYDRGGPVDRYYIDNFLEKNSPFVKGRVLEIGDNEYTLRFGGSKVTKSDILHVNDTNPNATFIGDLTNAPQIPSDAFDCIILTQTLHLIYDYQEAIKTCYRILKRGGVLLLTTPGITPIDVGEWKSTWYWAFTDIAVQKIVANSFSEKNTVIEAYGNVMTATAFLYGMGLQEVTKQQLDYHDPSYQVTITAIATKF